MINAYSTWAPRPDQVERFDEQTSFYRSRHTGVTFLVGGNGSGTTETALAKVANFILQEQEPPRRDTPFWILGTTLDQITETAWKEKLHGHGHIKSAEIDWPRIRWHDPKAGLPVKVPLKSWPGKPGRNWTLEFKSYDQGRDAMQARAIGGFLFVEQFPWVLLTEVLRGCREYSFSGNKLCEFTPVDPAMSAQLEDMIETDSMPPDWHIYRCNTECAMEAGHVSAEWFAEFFGMVSDEMRETRLTGQFASYEGTIYQSFNPAIHFCTEEEAFPNGDFPSGVWHRRGIDWGAGPDNAEACVWGYRNGLGQWTIYDEYWSTDQTMTQHDHLRTISDHWPWPRNNPYWGMTYADPSSPDHIRLASRFSEYVPGYDDISIQNANNRVYEGIEHIRWLLKPAIIMPDGSKAPRLRILRSACPHLSRTIRTYRWLRAPERGVNPRDARPEPLKKDDHLCDALRYMTFSEADITGSTPKAIRKERKTRKYGIQANLNR